MRLPALNVRSLERHAGTASLRGKIGGDAASRARSAAKREVERTILVRAEADYATLVESRQHKDEAAADGVRHDGHGPAAGEAQLHTPRFASGSTRPSRRCARVD